MRTIIAPGYAIIQRVDAPLVRAYLGALPDLPPDGRSLERVRYCLGSLQTPDVRYLVAMVVGPGAPAIARVAGAVLRAAGAPTATLGRSLAEAAIDTEPIDDELLARAGTLAAASAYQLADDRPQLGEILRRDAEVILALTAFAEAGRRVALLVDEGIDPADPLHAPAPDVVVAGAVEGAAVDRALALVPAGRPLVTAPLGDDARRRIEDGAGDRPVLAGGHDHRMEERDGLLELFIRDEPYVTLERVDGIAPWQLATGIAAALALGMMGIRMREEWLVAGIASLRAEAVTR